MGQKYFEGLININGEERKAMRLDLIKKMKMTKTKQLLSQVLLVENGDVLNLHQLGNGGCDLSHRKGQRPNFRQVGFARVRIPMSTIDSLSCLESQGRQKVVGCDTAIVPDTLVGTGWEGLYLLCCPARA